MCYCTSDTTDRQQGCLMLTRHHDGGGKLIARIKPSNLLANLQVVSSMSSIETMSSLSLRMSYTMHAH